MYDVELEPEVIKCLVNYRKLFDVLRISVDLDIYTHLASPSTAHCLSKTLGIDEYFLSYLLDTLLRIGLVDTSSEVDGSLAYRSSAEAYQYLNRESPLYLGKERLHDEETSKLLERFIIEGPSDDVVREDYWTREIVEKVQVGALLGGAQSVVKHIDLAGCRCLLDIGGGHGLYSIFLTKKYPHLRACILDLPQIISLTKENIERLRASARVSAVAGDYHTFKPSRRFDAVFVSNVTSDRDELRVLLGRCHSFLIDRGVVILRSFVSNSSLDVWSAMSTLERYARRGRFAFTRDDLITGLRDAGFVDVSDVHAANGVVIVRGNK
jgi:precorrin-6B methylase 2